MAVITISRGSFSGGKMLAECLADTLGYRCIDRDVIVEKAAAYGVTQEELRDTLDKPPSFLDRFKHRKYIYLTLIQAALMEEAVRRGNAIYHGNAGHFLLRGVTHVLKTRIIAPMEFRQAMVQDRSSSSPRRPWRTFRRWTRTAPSGRCTSTASIVVTLTNMTWLSTWSTWISARLRGDRLRGEAEMFRGDSRIPGGHGGFGSGQPREGQPHRGP